MDSTVTSPVSTASICAQLQPHMSSTLTPGSTSHNTACFNPQWFIWIQPHKGSSTSTPQNSSETVATVRADDDVAPSFNPTWVRLQPSCPSKRRSWSRLQPHMGSSATISKYGSRRFHSVGFDCSIQSTLNNSCSVWGRLCDNISFSALRPVGVQTYNTAGYSRLCMNCSLCWNLPVQLTPDFESSGAIQVHDFRPQVPRWWVNPSHLVHSRSSK